MTPAMPNTRRTQSNERVRGRSSHARVGRSATGVSHQPDRLTPLTRNSFAAIPPKSNGASAHVTCRYTPAGIERPGTAPRLETSRRPRAGAERLRSPARDHVVPPRRTGAIRRTARAAERCLFAPCSSRPVAPRRARARMSCRPRTSREPVRGFGSCLAPPALTARHRIGPRRAFDGWSSRLSLQQEPVSPLMTDGLHRSLPLSHAKIYEVVSSSVHSNLMRASASRGE